MKKIDRILDEYIIEIKDHFETDGWELCYTNHLSDILDKIEPKLTMKIDKRLRDELGISLLSDSITGVPSSRRNRPYIVSFTIGYSEGLLYYNSKKDKFKISKDVLLSKKWDDWEFIGGL